jgi:hypothetical protein
MARGESRYRDTDLGREARCSKCGEWWPVDSEFYYFLRGAPHSWCKACYLDDRHAKRSRAQGDQATFAQARVG